jgi:hypothetical protein
LPQARYARLSGAANHSSGARPSKCIIITKSYDRQNGPESPQHEKAIVLVTHRDQARVRRGTRCAGLLHGPDCDGRDSGTTMARLTGHGDQVRKMGGGGLSSQTADRSHTGPTFEGKNVDTRWIPSAQTPPGDGHSKHRRFGFSLG